MTKNKNPQSEVYFYRRLNFIGSVLIFLIFTWSIGIISVDWKITNNFLVRGTVLSIVALVCNSIYFRFYDVNRHYPSDDKNTWKSTKLFPYNRGQQYGVYEIFQTIVYLAIVVLQIYCASIFFRN
jgi:hypothetical protein